MFFITLFAILLFNSVASQGIFDPSTFTQGSCTGSNKWTIWFDTNDPSSVQGDFEITNHIKQLLPTYMCSSPSAIEAQTSYDTSPTTTGDVFRISTKDGFFCLNQQVNNYKNRLCTDYKVRYCCPSASISR
ncbi:unnamed protein product [Adineta ricciae]|uniref:WxxW domain-containing protein n=1 Tax=Adineta ricciae TaxID=249248 RepID=A0A815D1F4_ADIRI|nr:unnamed protein product [Adineta ricciae]CAF1291566.1 unnamed protein product [Adineta ricciae]